jgi:aminoglycoside/choline kinase family phosphotransferase
MPQRLDALTNWLRDVLNVESAGAQQTVDFQLTPASTDASFRRYFRLQVSPTQLTHLHMPQLENLAGSQTTDSPVTLIAMDAPPDKEETAPFVRVANLLVDIGLNAPRVLAQNTQQGFLLLGDLGTQAYLDVLNEDTVETLYADALNALWVMQRDAPRDTTLLPPYDESLLQREMALFSEWYCEQYCKLSFSPVQQSGLEAVFQQLSAAALAQPQVFVHRDYHSRNLMRVEENNPGILDFQDAVIGPVTYDLVSLLRDCYVAWPRLRVERWALDYLRHAADTGLIHRESDATWLRWFDWMGVQRHLKAVGIFARLYLRDGKPGYLNDIPRTLNYIRDVSARYPELQPLHALLDDLPQ